MWLILLLMLISALGGAAIMGMVMLDIYEQKKRGDE